MTVSYTHLKSVALKFRLRDSAHYKVAGFYTYGKNNSRRPLTDLPIYYFEAEEDFNRAVKKHGIHGILFSCYEDTRLEENRLLEYCKSNAVKTLSLIHIWKSKKIREILTPTPITALILNG